MTNTIFLIGKQIKNIISIFILIILPLSILSSCAGYKTIEPSLGITSKFYKNKPQEIIQKAKYDFSRLKKGYGLVIFSYHLDGFEEDIVSGTNAVKKQGLRIWEYQFSDKETDIKIVSEKMELFSLKTVNNAPNLYKNYFEDGKHIKKEIMAHLTFHKNKIIYGGRIIASDYENKGKISNYFDEDCTQFLDTYSTNLQDIEIDTILIKASKATKGEKKPYVPKSYYD